MLIRRSILATTVALAAGVVTPPSADAQIGVQRERNVPSVYAITNARIVPVGGAVIERGTDTKALFIDGRPVPLSTKHTYLFEMFKDRP